MLKNDPPVVSAVLKSLANSRRIVNGICSTGSDSAISPANSRTDRQNEREEDRNLKLHGTDKCMEATAAKRSRAQLRLHHVNWQVYMGVAACGGLFLSVRSYPEVAFGPEGWVKMQHNDEG